LSYITSLGGNAGLLGQALSTHAAVLDTPYVGGINDPPFEIVVGTGLPTITGVRVLPDGYVQINYGNGDTTVPAKSAARGPLGSANRNKAHTFYACGIDHVALPGKAQVTDAIDNFLKFGDPIDGLTNPCNYNGFQIRVFRLPAIAAAVAGRAGALADTPTPGPGGPMSVDDAVLNGLVDYLDFPKEKFIITHGEIPELTLPEGGFVEITPLSEDGDDGKGAPKLYGPITGPATLSIGAGGPVIQVDGQQAPVYGDMNCDGQVTTSDAFLLLLRTAGTPDPQPGGCPEIGSGTPPFGDLNCDNRVTVGDVLATLQIKSGYLFSLRRCQ
jgi:hypothetical protein